MKWDKKNKERLCEALSARFSQFVLDEEWKEWRTIHSIIQVRRGFPSQGGDRTCWCDVQDGKWVRIQNKERIIVLDPCGDRKDGLSIPKEVAEKFLLLGVP